MKIASSTDRIGVDVDDSLHTGLHGVMSELSGSVEGNFAKNLFYRLSANEDDSERTQTETLAPNAHPFTGLHPGQV